MSSENNINRRSVLVGGVTAAAGAGALSQISRAAKGRKKKKRKLKTFLKTKTLTGAYQLEPTKVWDSALRFTADMYKPGTHMCCSFTGPYKHFKLSKGGVILTDDPKAEKWFKRKQKVY